MLLPSCTNCVVLRELDVSVACAHVFVAIEADFIVVLRRPQSLVPNYVLHSQPKLYRWKRERERGGSRDGTGSGRFQCCSVVLSKAPLFQHGERDLLLPISLSLSALRSGCYFALLLLEDVFFSVFCNP